MKQTRRQRAASLRNLRKARARRGTRRRRRRRSNPRPRRRAARARRRNASSMPVVLVNPSGTRRRRTRRANPSRKRRRRRRGRVAVSRYQRRYPRIRNPAASWGGSLLAWALGGVGGLVAGGLDWGADYLPWPAWAQAVTLGGAGTVSSIAVCKFADVRAGCGIAGGTTALVLNRVRQIIALARTAPATGGGNASAVYRQAGAVVPARQAGQMRPRTAAQTMRTPALGGANFKQAGGPTYPAQGTRFGPNSWVYGQPGAGVVYVSAHGLRRQR